MGKNGFGSKRRRFGSIIHFLEFCLYQNDVVLDKTGPKRRRFEAAFTMPKTMSFGLVTAASKRRHFGPVLSKTTFCYVFKKNKKETTSFYLLQSQNDVVLAAPMPKYRTLFLVPVCTGEGGGGGEGRAARWIEYLT